MDLVYSFFQMIAGGSGLVAGDGPDGGLGLVMSGLAGVAAALAVALIVAVYFRTGYRSARDVVRHGLAATAVLGLLAFVAYDVGHAALAYLGINSSKPEVEFEIRMPKTALAALTDTQVERHTDRNQTLAQMRGALPSDDDGRSVAAADTAAPARTEFNDAYAIRYRVL